MQNCCENPVTVSLGDYIALTQKMVTMDAVTAQLGLIDGYNGAWNTASDYVYDAAEYVGDAWTTAWSSPADVAQSASSVSGEAADGVVSQAMSEFTQQVMSTTNQFLIDNFGSEVANVFFETTVTEGVATVGPSAAMNAAGTALMYVYYAYLAYVVFTLVVGIIYACEDEELDLAMKRDLLSTHYLGTYCAQEVFGVCIEKLESHCVFDSPMSRIMMEQVYMQPQMGLDWGTAKNPNCHGLALEDVSKVNWDDVDLDEWIGILISTGNFVDQSEIDVETLTGLGSYMTNGLDRDNVIESNIIRSEDYDADEISRDAYEEMWEEYQTPVE
ncbi:conjugal transfer protein TraN [Psychromonas sp. KJ10-2]|uniref:conjugal transfer protein TraN n=1 Tax=Psychromonas sp. KJ10-2 TaxID=3391822 RepID=UPI0039B3B2D2